MEKEFYLDVSIPANIRELSLGSAECEVREPDCLEACPKAKALSGKPLEFLLRKCTGTLTINQGCDSVKICNSPDRHDVRLDM